MKTQVRYRSAQYIFTRIAYLCSLLGQVALMPVVSATTLEEAVSQAINQNPQVLGAAGSVRAAGYDVTRARAGYYPSVDVDASYGREYSNIKQLSTAGDPNDTLSRREAGLTVRQLLWDGLATKNEVERRVALLNASQHSLTDTREAIAFRAVQAYLDVIRNRELVTLARDNVASHEKTMNEVTAKTKSGVGIGADVEQAQARYALAQSTLLAREGDLREAVARYERVVGEPPGELTTPERKPSGLVAEGNFDQPHIATAITAAQSEAAAEHPAILKSEAELAAAESEVKTAKAAYQPRLDLEGALRRDADIAGVEGIRNTEALMLVTRWNLFRGGADKAQEQAAIQRKYVAEQTADDTKQAVAENVAIAYQARATTESRISHLTDYVSASAATVQAYRAQFSISKRTLLDVLNAENELFNAKSGLTGGIFDDLVNQYFVEASKGQLTNSLGISPSEP